MNMMSTGFPQIPFGLLKPRSSASNSANGRAPSLHMIVGKSATCPKGTIFSPLGKSIPPFGLLVKLAGES